MKAANIVERHPILYHMAESGSWPSIKLYGLRSTTALLDLFGVEGDERSRIEAEWRRVSIAIKHPTLGTAVIRDQIPMPEQTLRECLVGLSPRQWYLLLNSKVFFWTTEDRLKQLLCARHYRGRSHTVLTVDTKKLLEHHASRVSLTNMNTGSTYFTPPKRSTDTFKSIEACEYPKIVELAVEYSVPDIKELVISVSEWQQDKRLLVYWKRDVDASA